MATDSAPQRSDTVGTMATRSSLSDDEPIPESDLIGVRAQHLFFPSRPPFSFFIPDPYPAAYDRLGFIQAITLLLERLRAWKHLCGSLENYVAATQKVQKAQSKEFEKILKVGI